MIRYAKLKTPIGALIATARDGALTGLYFDRGRHVPAIGDDWIEDARARPFDECARQIGEYFDGERKSFELPLAPEGSEFQRKVWIEIARIPFEETITYAELAKRAGAPGSARAAGAATGRNPISIIVPCHRVVGADGSLTGYAGGVPRKAKLLEIEDARQGALV